MILETVAAHALATYDCPYVLVISNDKEVRRGITRLTEKGVRAEASSPDDAPELLERIRVNLGLQLLQEGMPEINEFLKEQQQLIFEHVQREKISLSCIEGYGLNVEGDPLYNKTIHRVCAARPISVGRGLGGINPFFMDVPGDRYPIEFYVDVEFVLTVSRIDISFGLLGPEIRIDQPQDVDHLRWASVTRDKEYEDVTVWRSLTVYASVVRDPGPPQRFSDLQIHRVL